MIKGGGLLSEDVTQRVLQGINGAPQLKVDEKNRYLSNFKERVIFTVANQELSNGRIAKLVAQEVAQYPDGQFYFNGQMSSELQGTWIALATTHHRPFTIINNHVSSEATALGVVYAGLTAIDLPTVALLEKYPVETPPTKKDSVKEDESFWSRLFH